MYLFQGPQEMPENRKTRRWHVTLSCQPDGRPPQPVRPWKSGCVHLAEGSNVGCFRITVCYGVRAWSCCHLANGNKTCPRLFTYVINFENFMTRGRWISGVCRPKFTKRGTRVEQPSVLNKFLFRITIFCRVRGRESRKFAGGVWKCAKFRHFLAHPVV